MSNVLPMRPGATPFDRAVTGPAPDDPGGEDRGGKGPPRGGKGKAGGDFGPVVPLGTTTLRGTTAYVFLDAAGMVTMLSAAQLHGAAWISGLFGGEDGADTLKKLWPKRVQLKNPDGSPQTDDKGSPITVVVGFDPKAAGNALISACTVLGFAGAVELRRDGLWGHESGGLVMHCGRDVLFGGVVHRPGFRDGQAIYIAADPRPAPADDEATVAECDELEEALGLWNFRVAGAGPPALMGLIACGIYGAAAPWRPHLFVRGVEGSGKSSLNRLVAAACGAGEASTDTSEPGLRRMFDGRSGLLPLDEREANASGVQRVVDLMRGASDGRGAIVVRASAEGKGNDVFRVAGCFLMTAITQPKLSPADISRITLVELDALQVDSSEKVAAATAMAEALHPRILRRLMGRWGQWQANWRVAREAALARSATSRNADQLGALLAGWQVLVSDIGLSPERAAALMERLEAFVVTKEEAAEIGTANRVLQHLVASRVPVGMRHGDLMTVQNALGEAFKASRDLAVMTRKTASDPNLNALWDEAEEWRRKLGALGLRLFADVGDGAIWEGGKPLDSWPGKGPRTPALAICNGAVPIEAIFSDTPFAGGAWEGPLRDLAGAQPSRTSMKFPGAGQGRAVLLPLGLLGLEDSGDA